MKKLLIIASMAFAMSYNASAQNIQDLAIPFIPVPFIENPDLAMPDMDSEVAEPKKETSMNDQVVILPEDKDRQKRQSK
jgi:hypothetical protein